MNMLNKEEMLFLLISSEIGKEFAYFKRKFMHEI